MAAVNLYLCFFLISMAGTKMDLGGIKINVLGYQEEGLVGFPNELGVMTGDRAAESTLRDMQFLSNFTIEFRMLSAEEAPITSTDYFERWGGRMLQTGETDLVLGYFFVNLKRVKITTPLTPIMTDTTYLHFAATKHSLVYTFLKPIQPGLATAYVLTLVGSCLFVFFARFWLTQQKRLLKPSEFIILLVGVMCKQDNSRPLYSHTWLRVRLTLLVCSLITLFIHTLYGAQLWNVVQSGNTSLRNLQDLLDSGFHFTGKPSLTSNFPSEQVQKRVVAIVSWETSLRSLWTHKVAFIGVHLNSINEEILQRYRKLTHEDGHTADIHLCEILSSIPVGTSKVSLGSSFFVQKKSRFIETFNTDISRVRETGLLHRYMHYTEIDGLRCYQLLPPVEPFGFEEVVPLFYIHAGGLAFAVFAFVVEFLIRFAQKSFKHKRKKLIP